MDVNNESKRLNGSLELSINRLASGTVSVMEENDLLKISRAFSIHPKLIRFYVPLIKSLEDMEGEAQTAAQFEQNDAVYWSTMIRLMEEHRKSCRVNLP